MKSVTLGHGSNPKLESKLDLPSNPRPNRMELQEIRKSGDEYVVIKFEIGVIVVQIARGLHQKIDRKKMVKMVVLDLMRGWRWWFDFGD